MKKQLLTLTLLTFAILISKAQTWSGLGAGVDAQVLEITSYNGNIYAGGYFNYTGGTPRNHIAKWTGTIWSALGAGTNDIVTAMIEFNGEMYVGGDFTTAGGISANHIAKWNGTSWLNVGTTGIDGTIYDFIIFNNELYAGGNFITADGATVNNVAKWNGTTWVALGTGLTGFNDIVKSFAIFNNELYAGGNFNDDPGVRKWNGTSWSSVGTGMSGGSTDHINSLAVYNNKLYAAGQFIIGTSMYGTAFASLVGTTWLNAGTPENGPLQSLAVYNNELYLGGNIAGSMGGGNLVNNIKKWDGTNFLYVPGTNDYISTLYVNNGLYAGGYFTYAGGLPANRIARFANSLGVEENIKNDGLIIYPNPFNSQTTINFDQEQRDLTIKIIDILGKEIKTLNFSGKQLLIDKGEMNEGIYFVQVIDKNTNVTTRKIIIQ